MRFAGRRWRLGRGSLDPSVREAHPAPSRRRWVALALVTVAFGALPATVLCFPAGLGLVLSSIGAAGGEWSALVVVVWCLSGFAGAIALWAAAVVRPGRVLAACLVLGVLALGAVAWPFSAKPPASAFGALLGAWLYCGPLAVAALHLVRYFRAAKSRRSASRAVRALDQ